MNSEGYGRLQSLPVLGISGYSGSGKTTLIEAILPGLVRQGLRVAVVKHDAHQPEVDRAGKDSDRFFRAGADVFLRSPGENFCRLHSREDQSLEIKLLRLCQEYDLVLVEGYKHTPFRKIWLLGENEEAPPEDATGIIAVLPWSSDRVSLAEALIREWLL